MTVFRLHIRPTGGKNDAKISFDYCLRNSVLGCGWRIDNPPSENDKEKHIKATESEYNETLNGLRYFINKIKCNDLIWTRSAIGEYYIGKVEKEWEYAVTSESRDADIVNFVKCRLIKIPYLDYVPGKVIACFRPSRMIQAIRDETAEIYTKQLWNKLSEVDDYIIPDLSNTDIFSLLNSEEVENVLFIYLQTINWIVVPHTRKADTMRYEFSLVHRQEDRKAVIQVKTGHTWLNVNDFISQNEHVFLFQTNGNYVGSSTDHITCISPSEIINFMKSNSRILPANINHWMSVTNHGA